MRDGPYFKRAATFTIVHVASGHIVLDPRGNQICVPLAKRSEADALRSERQTEADRRAKRGPRACLCCTREFESDGVHNRLCGSCRHQTLAYAGPASTAAGRVRRAAHV